MIQNEQRWTTQGADIVDASGAVVLTAYFDDAQRLAVAAPAFLAALRRVVASERDALGNVVLSPEVVRTLEELAGVW